MWRIGKVTSEQLSLRLVEEREKLRSEHPGYRMIGPDFVCSDAAIGELCQEVEYFNSIDDVNTSQNSEREYLMYLWRLFQVTYHLDVM